MRRMFCSVLAIALLSAAAAQGQSVADAARQNSEKKQAEDATGARPKVFTNKNLPKDPNADPESKSQPVASAPASSASANRPSPDPYAAQRLAEQRAADQWKRRILAQRNKVITLQAQRDRLQSALQSANGTVHTEGPYNRFQARQQIRLAQVQQQLDQQQLKLEQMQEDARHAGMHTAVYDP
jgi:hypothetical protein